MDESKDLEKLLEQFLIEMEENKQKKKYNVKEKVRKKLTPSQIRAIDELSP